MLLNAITTRLTIPVTGISCMALGGNFSVSP